MNDELQKFVNGWLVEVGFGAYEREDLPKLANVLTSEIQQLLTEARRQELSDLSWVGEDTDWTPVLEAYVRERLAALTSKGEKDD